MLFEGGFEQLKQKVAQSTYEISVPLSELDESIITVISFLFIFILYDKFFNSKVDKNTKKVPKCKLGNSDKHCFYRK